MKILKLKSKINLEPLLNFISIDRDECIDHNGDCSNICINLLGSYSCACEAGFELIDDKHTCQDIGESLTDFKCSTSIIRTDEFGDVKYEIA